MATRPHTAAGSPADLSNSPVPLDRIARQDGRPQRAMPLMRRVEVACLAPNGDIRDFTRIVPALPAFEGAFAAFARGTILATDRGHIAVEDLWPGDALRTVEDGFQQVLWKGSTLLIPCARGQDPVMGHLTRIAADALGIARPAQDLVLGPCARLAHRAPGIERLVGTSAALIPARDFIDGCNIVEVTPPSPVQTYHVALPGHFRILANGVEVESYHPGPAQILGLRSDMLDLFLSCFPHVAGLEDFGTTCLPHLRLGDLDLVHVA